MMFLLKKKIHEHEQRFSTNKNPLSIANCTKRKKSEKNLIHWLTIFSKFLPT